MTPATNEEMAEHYRDELIDIAEAAEQPNHAKLIALIGVAICAQLGALNDSLSDISVALDTLVDRDILYEKG